MPVFDIRCPTCNRQWERICLYASKYLPCETCGGPVEQAYSHSVQATVFTPYFDIGLGQQINSLPERRKAMRNARMDYRDLPDKGTLSARRDRMEERRKEERR